MSPWVYALTVALLVLTAFVLTDALDSNRTPRVPAFSEGSEGSSPNMNWPEAKTEGVTMPPAVVGAVANIPSWPTICPASIRLRRNIPPIITIGPGFRLNIELTTDVTQLVRAVVTGF